MYPISYDSGPLAAAGGVERSYAVSIGFQPRGVLTRLYVVQTAGSLDGFTYALYTYSGACPPGTSPSSRATVAPGLYQLVPLTTVAAGQSAYVGTWPGPTDGINRLWLPYAARGDTGSQGDAFNLYLDINPAGTGSKVFQAALTALCETGR